MIDVKDILIELGFSNISDHANYYRTKPIYRDSGNSSILSVNKKTGHFVDFGRRGDGIFTGASSENHADIGNQQYQ